MVSSKPMQRSKRQIIAIGGGGLSNAREDSDLISYLLHQTSASTPKVCFIPTASGDPLGYIESFYGVFSQRDCQPCHLPLFARTPDLRSLILNQDLIYVGGGNTKSMLAVWKEWGLDAVLREAWQAGIVLSGVSAGAICWFQQGITDSFADELRVLDCLGFLEGSCCPHYNGEPERRPTFHRLLAESRIVNGFALEDYSAIHFTDEDSYRAVAFRPGARVYSMHRSNAVVQEQPLDIQVISGTPE